MNPFLIKSNSKFIIFVFFLWRLNLELLAFIGGKIVPVREGFISSIPWGNFDGIHYISIAQSGYYQYEQAFFPLYPMLIRFLGKWFFNGNYVLSAFLLSNICIIISLFIFWKLLRKVKINKKPISNLTIRWILLFTLFFPTGFYFGSMYTESLFLLLVLLSFYLLQTKRTLWFGIIASLASATRLVGVFLLVPAGLFIYMFYLLKKYNDPLLFVHAQPAFGAGRSGGDPIFLPQVYWRYLNMFYRIAFQHDTFTYFHGIALFELVMFHLALYLLWIASKKKLPDNWLLFSVAAIIGPTLTGSLSSMPRYILVAFPIFIMLGMLYPNIRKLAFIISYIVFSVCTILFSRGYWIS